MDLTENEITEEGARELAGGMRNNKSLLTLVLSRNPVGDAGATALAFGKQKEAVNKREGRKERDERGSRREERS